MSSIIKHSTQICQRLDKRIDIFLWKIKNFSSIRCTQNFNETLIYGIFGPKSSEGLWRIAFSIFKYGTMFLIQGDLSNEKDSLQTSFEIVVINKNSSKNIQITEKNNWVFEVEENIKASNFCLILHKNLFEVVKLNPSSWLKNDTLTISIKAVRVHEPTKINYPLMSGLLSYLKNEKFSDIILEVDGKELKAHKMMLSLKSPVFSAMFDHESMNESRDNRVVIKDIDADVVKQMLEYIYTGKTPSKIDNCVYDLIGAAHKYQINDLQEICENNLLDKLAVDNAVKTLIIADFYHAEKLKNKVVEFIKQNVSIFDSDEFKDLESKNANLAITILRKLIPGK